MVVVGTCALALTGCGAALGHPSSVTVLPSASTRPATTTTAAAIRAYVVVRGDTLTAIAHRFGVQPDTIAAANHLANADALTVGQTLRIPPVQPLALTITPAEGPAGTSFELQLTGVPSSDTATFSIARPGHPPFTGPSHTAAADGSIAASYTTYPTDPGGQYVVLARTSSGKAVFGELRVDAAGPSGQAP